MLDQLSLSDEIALALPGLKPEVRKLIDSARAEVAFSLVLEMRTRPRNPVKDRGEAIRYGLSATYVGTGNGQQAKRQKVFGAYFLLLVRVLGNRERRTHRSQRRAA